jgi:hypothetical protein
MQENTFTHVRERDSLFVEQTVTLNADGITHSYSGRVYTIVLGTEVNIINESQYGDLIEMLADISRAVFLRKRDNQVSA